MSTHSEHWPLFDEFPKLERLLTPVKLAELATPVQAIASLGPNAWIKRDDLTHPVYGGNKMRKLEFVLAEIRRKHSREVFTLGATGTNAGIAISMICEQENIPCTIITFPQKDSPTVQKNQAWMQKFHARYDHRKTLWQAVLRYYLHPSRCKKDNYFLFAGCSNAVSTFAYVNAAFELRQQIRTGLCPEPAEIIIPVSSASTLAGLTLGVALAGLSSRVIGVRVAAEKLGPFAACTPAVVNKMAAQALATIRQQHRGRAFKKIPSAIMNGDYFGPGYGEPTAAAQNAIAVFEKATGLQLESTYSGKAAAAFLDRLPLQEKPVLFWNTFNSRVLETDKPVKTEKYRKVSNAMH